MVRHCKKTRPYQPVTTTLKEISLLSCTLKCTCVTQLRSEVTTPTPSPAENDQTGTNLALKDPDQKDLDLREEKSRKGDARGKPDFEAISDRVVGRVNELRPLPPKGKPFRATTYYGDIGKLVKAKFTEADMMTVIEWKADECKRKGNWGWFKPDTLFRSTLFAKKLDEANAGVDVSGQSSLFKPKQSTVQKQSEQQDYTPPEGWK